MCVFPPRKMAKITNRVNLLPVSSVATRRQGSGPFHLSLSVSQMKLFGNVFLSTAMELETTAVSICCSRVSPNGATPLGLRRKGE